MKLPVSFYPLLKLSKFSSSSGFILDILLSLSYIILFLLFIFDKVLLLISLNASICPGYYFKKESLYSFLSFLNSSGSIAFVIIYSTSYYSNYFYEFFGKCLYISLIDSYFLLCSSSYIYCFFLYSSSSI